MRPETRYAEHDGALIAYQVVGEGPIDLVYMSGGTSQVDMRWEHPRVAHFLERLASFSRLITFDRRGAGLSDPISLGETADWEGWARDLTTVLDEVGSKRAVLFAVLDAGPIALLYAAGHPDRVSGLVLGNTAPRLLWAEDFPSGLSPEAADAFVEVVRASWGRDSAFSLSPVATADPATADWFVRFCRASGSPNVIAAQLKAMMPADFRPALRLIQAPTLVLHRSVFPPIPAGSGRYLAEHIPGARFVEVPGTDSSFFFDGADFVLDAVQEFVTGARPAEPDDRVLRTMLLLDIVGSTSKLADVGDRRWKAVLDRLDEVLARELGRHQGRTVHFTGDGVLAMFDTPGRAIRCALAVGHAMRAHDVELRAGVHTGEVELRGELIGGIAVHIAARVAALAEPGEVLVSRTVADLVAGSGLRLGDRGTHTLRGVPGAWQLFAAATS